MLARRSWVVARDESGRRSDLATTHGQGGTEASEALRRSLDLRCIPPSPNAVESAGTPSVASETYVPELPSLDTSIGRASTHPPLRRPSRPSSAATVMARRGLAGKPHQHAPNQPPAMMLPYRGIRSVRRRSLAIGLRVRVQGARGVENSLMRFAVTVHGEPAAWRWRAVTRETNRGHRSELRQDLKLPRVLDGNEQRPPAGSAGRRRTLAA